MEYVESLNKIKESIYLGEFEKNLGIKFKNKELLLTALTHKSYTFHFKKSYKDSNERFEFLGDAVLGLVISEYLMDRFPEANEGELTKIKSYVVSKKILYEVALNLNLNKFILVGRNEFLANRQNIKSIMADTVESIIGAIYIDSGYSLVKKFILKHFKEYIENYTYKDYKTILQDIVQKNLKITPQYKLIKEEGPQHKKVFYVKVFIQNKEYGIGEGKNKKEAEQNAARLTIEILEKEKATWKNGL